MTERLKEIFSAIPACRTFADVGCDHGYIACAMIKSGKCKRVIVSDVSEKSLDKAKKLLSRYIKEGLAQSVLSDGFKNLPECDCALIAGLGGDLIIKIMEEAPFLPQTLVLQPMKNAPKLREYAVNKGYCIKRDSVFCEGNIFYDLIVLSKGKDELTEEEIKYGRTNVKERGEGFLKKIAWETSRIDQRICAKNLKPATLKRFLKEREELSRYVKN